MMRTTAEASSTSLAAPRSAISARPILADHLAAIAATGLLERLQILQATEQG